MAKSNKTVEKDSELSIQEKAERLADRGNIIPMQTRMEYLTDIVLATAEKAGTYKTKEPA